MGSLESVITNILPGLGSLFNIDGLFDTFMTSVSGSVKGPTPPAP